MSLTAAELAARLAQGERITVLDVRDDDSWPLDVATVHIPAREIGDDLRLVGPVAVVCQRGRTAAGVARTLREHGVDAHAVEHGMRGWISALQAWPVDLGIDGLTVHQVQRPGRGCLSYVLVAGGEAVVVDPAPNTGFYVELVAGARVTAVFDTHLHADHLSGARALANATGAMLRMPASAAERGARDVTPVGDGETIAVGPVTLTARALPGHTTDMTGLLVEDRALIAGDSVFADGIARPDLQRGDRDGTRAMARLLHATLHERVLSLGHDVVLLPCHTHPGVQAAAVTARIGELTTTVPELGIGDPDAFADHVLAAMPPRPANYETIIAVNAGAQPFDPDLETGPNSCSTR